MLKETLLKSMKKAISNVMETMFFQSVHINDSHHLVKNWFSKDQPLLGAKLGFSGPVSGTCYIFTLASDVEEMTADFLGIAQNDVHKDQVRDTIKETLNMISGNMLSINDDPGAFQLGIPELMDEKDLVPEQLEDLKMNILFIETNGKRLGMGLMIT